MKYGINSIDCKNKLRIIILIGAPFKENQLKQQLEMSESHKDCTLDIQILFNPDSKKLTRIFQANENYKSYSHTLIMLDEIDRYKYKQFSTNLEFLKSPKIEQIVFVPNQVYFQG